MLNIFISLYVIPKMINLPNAPYVFKGSFLLRDAVLTLVNLGKHFDMLQKSENLLCESDDGLKGQVIVLNLIKCVVLFPIVMFTGMDDDEICEEAAALGVYDFIYKKAFTVGLLKRSISQAIQGFAREKICWMARKKWNDFHILQRTI